jgi:hypothetical protein
VAHQAGFVGVGRRRLFLWRGSRFGACCARQTKGQDEEQRTKQGGGFHRGSSVVPKDRRSTRELLAARLPAPVAIRDAAKMTCAPPAQVDVDQPGGRDGRRIDEGLRGDKFAMISARQKGAGVTRPATRKKAGMRRPCRWGLTKP